jgi:hypothetical protein
MGLHDIRSYIENCDHVVNLYVFFVGKLNTESHDWSALLQFHLVKCNMVAKLYNFKQISEDRHLIFFSFLCEYFSHILLSSSVNKQFPSFYVMQV